MSNNFPDIPTNFTRILFLKFINCIFSKITGINNFWGHDHFSRNGVSDDKNEYNLFYKKWNTEYDFEIFSSKILIPAEWKLKKQFREHIFPNISGPIGPIVSKKNKVYSCVDPDQPCDEFHENRFKTAACIAIVIIIISWKSMSVIF